MSTPTLTPTGYATEEPTHPPPWHGLVVWDVFCNALTTGLFMTAAVGELARPDVFAPVAVWSYPLALALLLIDLTLLVLDLGDPLRFHHMLRVFKPSSPMSLGTWCLTLYSLPLAALVAVDLVAPAGAGPIESALPAVRKVLSVAALPFCFGSMAYKGVLFSTSAQPGWKDARWLGAYHVASAFALGSALLLGFSAVLGYDRPAAALVPAVAALVVGQAVALGPLAAELRGALTKRPSRGRPRATAIGAVGAGVLLPLAALAVGGPIGWAVAAIGVLSGGWVVRWFVLSLPHDHHEP